MLQDVAVWANNRQALKHAWRLVNSDVEGRQGNAVRQKTKCGWNGGWTAKRDAVAAFLSRVT